jgi:hypothetical protein
MPKLSYYDPQASHMRADTLADFLRAPLPSVLEDVPGIGKDTATKLAAAGITSPTQLIGVYLQLGDCDVFYKWLQTRGVNAHRNTVVRSISEKAAGMVVMSTPCAPIEEEVMEVDPPPALPTVDHVASREELKSTKNRAKKTRQRQARRKRKQSAT